MDEPIYLTCRLTLDDFTDAEIASARALRPGHALFVNLVLIYINILMFCCVALGVFFLAHEWFMGAGLGTLPIGITMLMVYSAFLHMMRCRDRIGRALHRAVFARKLKGSAMLEAPYQCWVSDEEFITESKESQVRIGWESVKRVVETRRCFIAFLYSNAHPFIPARAFHSREDIDRFIALAREKASKYDVIKPIEYELP